MADDDTMGGGEDTATGGADTIDGGADTLAGGGADTIEGSSILARGGVGDDTLKGAADWPEDWRSKALEGEDADKYLKRLNSVPDLAKSYVSAQKKLEEMRAKPAGAALERPKDADDAQLAEFRKEAGIPEKPEGYLESLPDGLILGEEDKPAFDNFASAMHEADMPKGFADRAMAWYHGFAEEQAAALAESDREAAAAAVEELRQEMGPEYRANMTAAKNYLESAPDGVRENFLGGRGADGRLLGDNPDVLRWLASQANEANPAGFVAPADGKTQVQSVNDRIAQIESTMKTDRPAYNRDTAMQEELRKLYEAREKIGKAA